MLALFDRRGVRLELGGVDQLIAACARNDATGVRAVVHRAPHLVKELLVEGGRLLVAFAGNGNAGGVRSLLDLGVDVAASFTEGDGYFDVAEDSTALHVAAWRAPARRRGASRCRPATRRSTSW